MASKMERNNIEHSPLTPKQHTNTLDLLHVYQGAVDEYHQTLATNRRFSQGKLAAGSLVSTAARKINVKPIDERGLHAGLVSNAIAALNGENIAGVAKNLASLPDGVHVIVANRKIATLERDYPRQIESVFAHHWKK